MEEYTREPCPWRIGDDLGGAFSMGTIGGAVFHAFRGYRDAAMGQKMVNILKEVRCKSPITGGQFAAWGGLFSTIDCSLASLRKKEDPLNSIASGGLTGALLTMRMGRTAMISSAIMGCVLLAMIDGVGLVLNRFQAPAFDPTLPPPPEPILPDSYTGSATKSSEEQQASSFGNMFDFSTLQMNTS